MPATSRPSVPALRPKLPPSPGARIAWPDGIPRAKGQLSGIANGIDESWDPCSGPHLSRHFHPNDLNGKQANADLVRKGLCLALGRPAIWCRFPLGASKGAGPRGRGGERHRRNGGQIAILGLGDPEIEHMLSRRPAVIAKTSAS